MLVYMRVQYAQESVAINEKSEELSAKQKERGEAMQRAGSISRSEYSQLVSQYSSDHYNLVNAQSTLNSYELQLKQLLELPASTQMLLAETEINEDALMETLPTMDEVYQRALDNRPEIAAAKKNIEAADLTVDKAKAGYYPTIGLSAGSSISHSSAGSVSVAEQIKQGWNNSVGININVPIVDGRSAKSSVEKAKIQKAEKELQLQEDEKTLRKTIESLWMDAYASQQQFVAAKDKLTYAQESYDLVSEQFNVGVKHATDLLQAQQSLLSAQQEMIQTKYMAQYSINMLKYYQGTL